MGIRFESTVEADGAGVRWRVRLQVRVKAHQLVRLVRVLTAVTVAALLAGCG